MPRPGLRVVLAAMALGLAMPGVAQPRNDQILIEARMIELSRSKAEELGVDWTGLGDRIGAQVIDFGGRSALSTPHANFSLIIDALASDRLSRVVADPRIATLDNGVAEVSVQSPVPLPTVDFKDVGIALQVTPTVVADGVLTRIDIATGGLTVPPGGTVPIIDQRQLDTSVLLPTGRALAIGGLFPDDMGKTAVEVPFLGDIPYLGALFRSRNFQEGRTKPLAFVFPYTIGTAAGVEAEDEGEPIGPVMLQVRLVEASRSTFQDLGIDWQGSQIDTMVLDLGNLAPDASDPQAGFETFLDAIEASALTRMLAAPNLATLGDGSSALNIESPAEFPTIHFNEFGVTLSFTPRVNDDDSVSLEINGESNGLTFPAGGNIPAFETRQLQTSVEIRNGETLAIGGLFADDMAEVDDKLPFFADIPVLGALFRSESDRNDATELVIIVSPYLVAGYGDSEDDSGGSTSSGTAAAQPSQPRSTDQGTTSTGDATTAVATPTATDQTPTQNGQGGLLSGSLEAIFSRLDLNSQAGGGVIIFPGFETFASQGPGSIRMNGFELSINLDLDQANLFGVPDVVSRLISSGQPTSKLYASFSRTSGDAEDHVRDSNTALDYGIVFAEEFNWEKGLKFLGVDGAGLYSMTRTESTWYRAAAGVKTEYPNVFGNPRLSVEKDFGVFLEKLETDYDADTVVLFNDIEFPDFGSQNTTADVEDRYLGILLGKTLYYALTERLRIGVGGELSVSHRSSSAEVRQHNVSSLAPPLDDFELVFDYDDSGIAVGFGAAVLAEYLLTDRVSFKLAYRRQTLPGATMLVIPETTDQIPVDATQESATRRSVLFAVNYDF